MLRDKGIHPHQAMTDFRQNLERTLIAAVLVALALGVDYSLGTDRFVRGYLGAILVFSQLTWAAIWLVKGQGWLIVRLLPGLAIIQLQNGHRYVEPDLWPMYFAVAVTCLLMHTAIVARYPWLLPVGPAAHPRRQFSLGQILEVTTAVAIGMAFVIRQPVPSRVPDDYAVVVPLLLTLAISSLAAAWAVMGTSTRFVAGLLFLPLGLILLGTLLSLQEGDFLSIIFLHMVVVALGMAVYRLYQRTRRLNSTAAVADSPLCDTRD